MPLQARPDANPLAAPLVCVASPTSCVHCGADLPASATNGFCCTGCETVHSLLSENGLERYYSLRGGQGTPVPETHPESRDWRWLEPLSARIATAEGAVHVSFDLQGMQCAACVWLIEQLFAKSSHALRIIVNPGSGRVEMDVTRGFDLDDFAREIERFGYLAGPPRAEVTTRRDGLLLRLAVCVALAMNAMIFALPIYLGLHDGVVYHAFRWITFALSSASVVVGGSVFFRSAIAAAQRRILHLDVPIALGIASAYAGSTYAFAVGNDRGGYFDTLNVFIALMLVGRYLQQRVLEKNRQSLLESDAVETLLARRIDGDGLSLVKCAELKRGDAMLVARGELLPIDGVLESDRAACSLDWIQGESEPREYLRGDIVPAGAFNAGASPVTLRALTDFAESQLLPLLRNPRETGTDVARSTRWWQRLSGIYVVAVLIASVGTFVGWLVATHNLQLALQVTTAVLVVTCPCAFGIAAPVAYEITLQRLREQGLFVRSASFLDRAVAIRTIVFDKTGTLTTGIPTVIDVGALRALPTCARDVLFNLASRSNHPRSIAVRRALEGWAEFRPEFAVTEAAGHGMEAMYAGRRYRFGAPAWAHPPSRELHSEAVVFACENESLAVVHTEERFRPDAANEIRALRDDGYDVRILSGDTPRRVREAAQQLGIAEDHVEGGFSPTDKARWLSDNDHHDTLMIGDGINDALALTTAFASGTPAIDRPFVPSRADFYFTTAGLRPIALVLAAAKKLSRIHRRNLCAALAYNALAVGFAAAGFITPIVCAVIMPLSSLSLLLGTTASFTKGVGTWRF